MYQASDQRETDSTPMAVKPVGARAIVEHVCARPDVLDACARRDLGAVIEALTDKRTGGLTQGKVAELTGIPQGRALGLDSTAPSPKDTCPSHRQNSACRFRTRRKKPRETSPSSGTPTWTTQPPCSEAGQTRARGMTASLRWLRRPGPRARGTGARGAESRLWRIAAQPAKPMALLLRGDGNPHGI